MFGPHPEEDIEEGWSALVELKEQGLTRGELSGCAERGTRSAEWRGRKE